MSKKVRSARGEIVDFDLLKIKQQIAATPSTSIVHEREMQIDRKLKRKVKKVETPAPKVKAVEKTSTVESNQEEKGSKKQRARIQEAAPISQPEQDNTIQEIHTNATETDQQ